MTDWNLPWDGGCRCGAVRIRVTAPPLLSMACHCTGCQTMSASAFSLSIAIPAEGFEVTKGETEIGGLHGSSRHSYCGYCKSWMFTRPEGMEWFVNLRPSTLDDHGWFVPFAETCREEGLPWATTGAAHSYEGIPPMEAFEDLMKAYAVEGARPSQGDQT
jgi:hypothetical protein